MGKPRQILGNGEVSVRWDRDGGFTLSSPPFVFRNCRPTVFLKGAEFPLDEWELVSVSSEKAVFSAVDKCGKWRLEFALDPADRLTVRFGGTLKRPCNDVALRFSLGKSIAADHLHCQGVKKGGCTSRLLKSAPPREFEGYYQLILTVGEKHLQLSLPLQSRFITSFSGKCGRGRISDFQTSCSIRNYSGRDVELPPLTLRQGDGIAMMLDYADENCRGEKDFSGLTAPGWNSWDYYRWTVTEDDILENAEFIAADPVLSKHVKRIIVDDGWQYAYGEWEANSLFPHGMAYLADRIRKLGMEPGLWVAPTIFDLHARIVQKNPEMLAKSAGGLPAVCWEIMKRRVFLLDPTVEASQRYIRDLFEKMLRWGYTYFKLDFLGSQLSARSFVDRSVTQGELMDLTIGTAYRQVAGRAKLLGCNYLFCGGDRIADLVRVGSDVRASWKNIKSNAVSIAARFWANKKLWINDPDFALCRSMDTSDDPEMKRIRPALVFIDPDDPATSSPWYDLSLVDDDVRRPQMEVLLSLVLTAGGAVTLSDRMNRLNESGLDLARRTVAAESGEAAIPLDLFKSEIPSRYLQKLSGGCRVLLINWEEQERELTIDLRSMGIECRSAVNFWNDRPVRLRGGRIEEILPARSCLLVELK